MDVLPEAKDGLDGSWIYEQFIQPYQLTDSLKVYPGNRIQQIIIDVEMSSIGC